MASSDHIKAVNRVSLLQIRGLFYYVSSIQKKTKQNK